jgi:hypothetical protein
VDLYIATSAIKAAQAAQTQALIAAIQAMPGVDAAQVAQLVAPQVVAGITASLPDMDGATPDQVEERVKVAVRAVLGGLDN